MGTDEHNQHKKDNAPYNPLSPHADDPAWAPGPPTHNGEGGEYDQKPYVVRAAEVDQTPEAGEYDRKPPQKQRHIPNE